MHVWALIKTALEAVIALPKIITLLSEEMKRMKLEHLEKEYEQKLQELDESIKALKEAKDDAELRNFLRSRRERS